MTERIEDKNEKRRIARAVLESLKEWFEVDESREKFIRESAERFSQRMARMSQNHNGVAIHEREQAPHTSV